jgi:hypothetical protein
VGHDRTNPDDASVASHWGSLRCSLEGAVHPTISRISATRRIGVPMTSYVLLISFQELKSGSSLHWIAREGHAKGIPSI